MTTSAEPNSPEPASHVRAFPFRGSTSRPNGLTNQVAWARDGDRILLAEAGPGWVAPWQLKHGTDTFEPLRENLPYPNLLQQCVAWARDGERLLLAAGGPGWVTLWQLRSGGDRLERLDRLLLAADEPVNPGTPSVVSSLAWVREGDRLWLAAGAGSRGRAARRGPVPRDGRGRPGAARLRTALRRITDSAAAQGLYLPGRLDAWLPWVVPTARLSFPAGRVVGSLQPQQ